MDQSIAFSQPPLASLGTNCRSQLISYRNLSYNALESPSMWIRIVVKRKQSQPRLQDNAIASLIANQASLSLGNRLSAIAIAWNMLYTMPFSVFKPAQDQLGWCYTTAQRQKSSLVCGRQDHKRTIARPLWRSQTSNSQVSPPLLVIKISDLPTLRQSYRTCQAFDTSFTKYKL